MAAEEIKSRHPQALIEVVELDLARLSSVFALVKYLSSRDISIDILINNAGKLVLSRFSSDSNSGAMLAPSRTPDGFDTQFSTNYLGHFLLTVGLYETGSLASHARIVNVSSAMHWMGTS